MDATISMLYILQELLHSLAVISPFLALYEFDIYEILWVLLYVN